MEHATPLVTRRARPPRPAFADVCSTSLDTVVRFLAHMTGDRHLAEDLAADAFERALRSWHRYDPAKAAPHVWIIAIARRVALDHARAEGRRLRRERRYALEHDPRGADDAPAGVSPALRAAVAALPPAEREVLGLRVVAGLGPAEVAAVTGTSPSAVGTRLHRALTRLRLEVPRDAID